jgi:hypothetical protein
MGILQRFLKEHAKDQALIPKLRDNLISCRGQNVSFSLYNIEYLSKAENESCFMDSHNC